MAKRNEIVEETFGVSVRWPPASDAGDDGHAATAAFGWLRLCAGDHALTEYRCDDKTSGNEILAPLYHLAEWIAVNWWALLFEPKKTDDAEQDIDFRSRHWVGLARNGFALPDTWIIPAGGRIEISSFACQLPATHIEFTKTARAVAEMPQVRETLARFVDEVHERLRSARINGSLLDQAWDAIRATPPAAEEFCRLMGSLGLSPYDEHPAIEALLDHLSETLDAGLLRDLCEAVSPKTLSRVANAAAKIWQEVGRAPEVDLSALPHCPPDTFNERAAKWGIDAAFEARKSLGIKMADPSGGDHFFEAMRLPPTLDNMAVITDGSLSSDLIAGGVERIDDAMRFALVQDEDVARRRFAGARASFLAWSAKQRSARLMTDARTRDQQASRAFAAEILAPLSFIKSKATNGILSLNRARELSLILGVSPAVIANQAKNAGLGLASSGSW